MTHFNELNVFDFQYSYDGPIGEPRGGESTQPRGAHLTGAKRGDGQTEGVQGQPDDRLPLYPWGRPQTPWGHCTNRPQERLQKIHPPQKCPAIRGKVFMSPSPPAAQNEVSCGQLQWMTASRDILPDSVYIYVYNKLHSSTKPLL